MEIAKEISEEESVKVKKFTDDLMELMKDILNNPTCLASTMLKDYMDIMRLKKDFSKHPSAPDNGYNIIVNDTMETTYSETSLRLSHFFIQGCLN